MVKVDRQQGPESKHGVHQDPPPHVLKTDSLQVRRINQLCPQRKQPKFKLPRGPNRTSREFMIVYLKSRVPRGTGQKPSSMLRFKKSSLNNYPRENGWITVKTIRWAWQ